MKCPNTGAMESSGEKRMKRGRIRIVVISILILIVVIGLVIRQLPGNRMKRLIKQGNDLLLEQEYEKAADVFTRALDIDSKNASAFFARGDAYAGIYQSGRTEREHGRCRGAEAVGDECAR